MHHLKHCHWWFVMYAMLKLGEDIVAKNVARLFTLYEENPGKEKMKDMVQQVTCNTCIEETPIETNSETCSHLTLDKFLSNKMKENKNDIRALVGKTVTTEKKESGARGRKQRKEMAREISKQGHWMNEFMKKANSNVGLSENNSVAIVDAHQSTNIDIDNEVVDVIMNKLIEEVCDEIESNKV